MCPSAWTCTHHLTKQARVGVSLCTGRGPGARYALGFRRRWETSRLRRSGSQSAGRAILMRGCWRDGTFLEGANRSALPGGGPIVQPRVSRPQTSHRKNRRAGSRPNVSSCPRNRQRSVEGLNERRSTFHMRPCHFVADGGRGRRLERTGAVRLAAASQLTTIARLPMTSARAGVCSRATSTPGLNNITTVINTTPHSNGRMPRLCHGLPAEVCAQEHSHRRRKPAPWTVHNETARNPSG